MPKRIVLIAPHPDDEILGAGGTVATLAAGGAQVLLIAVTDGEASHPGRQEDLRRMRPAETRAAMTELGLDDVTILRLRHGDGSIDAVSLGMVLRRFLRPGDLVLAPWSGDGHPDHDVVGGMCEEISTALGVPLWSYLVWTWHWADPTAAEVPWARAARVDLESGIQEAKFRAINCFSSQTGGVQPILSPDVLARFRRPFEVFLI